MSENFAELLEEHTVDIERGDVVKGNILEVTRNHVFVDIGFKSIASIDADEFKTLSGEVKVKSGDESYFYVLSLDNGSGEPVLSHEKAKNAMGWEKMRSLVESGEGVEGVVFKAINNGLLIDIDGMQAFMPGNLVDIRPVKDFSFLIGKTVKVKVLKANEDYSRLIVSRKAMLANEDGSVEKFLNSVKVGDTVKGVVKNIAPYGAFVDLGGIDGLVHITDMSWGRIDSPHDVCKVGDELTMMVNKFDKERSRISLSLKEIHKEPWDNFVKENNVGDIVNGEVAKITDNGVFVQLETGVVGLIQTNEISWSAKNPNPEKFYEVGEEISVKVIDINHEKGQISLSTKRKSKNPWETFSDNYDIGDKVKGTVKNVTDYGIFIELDEGVVGVVPQDEVSWSPEIRSVKGVEAGDEIESVIKRIDVNDERLMLSIRELTPNPLKTFVEESRENNVSGVVKKIAKKSITVSLGEDVYGIIRHGDAGIGDQDLKDIYSIDEEIKAKVIGEDQGYVKLSVKAMAS